MLYISKTNRYSNLCVVFLLLICCCGGETGKLAVSLLQFPHSTGTKARCTTVQAAPGWGIETEAAGVYWTWCPVPAHGSHSTGVMNRYACCCVFCIPAGGLCRMRLHPIPGYCLTVRAFYSSALEKPCSMETFIFCSSLQTS